MGTLADFFIQNNECSGESKTKVAFDTTRTLFRIKLAPGLDDVASKNFAIDAGGPALGTALGAGVAYKRFTLEARYYPTRTLHKLCWLDYQKSSLIVGYRIFN